MAIPALENNGIIFNLDMVITVFSERIGKYTSEDEIQKILSKGIEIFFYNKNSLTYTDISCEEQGALLKVIKTHAIDATTGHNLCFSYNRDKDGDWVGCYVGTQAFLHRRWLTKTFGITQDTPKNKRATERVRALQEIYDNLFYKESWKSGSSLRRLDEYIWAIKKKLENEYKKGNKDYLVFNKLGNKVIFNSRLLDNFGNYINLMANYRYGTLGDVEFVSGIRMQRDNSFEAMILNIKPVEFFTHIDEVVFRGTMADFDFTNSYALNHVINERRYRFPENVKDRNTIEIVNALKTAVEHSIKMSQIDYKFVVPMYNIEYDNIQFLMPIYFSFGENETPSMALVVDKNNGFWSIRTILSIEDAYANARAIGSPNIGWLKVDH